jgi:(1->4)-alpha-D-glucan 1-alpha-D-glucosylmutase
MAWPHAAPSDAKRCEDVMDLELLFETLRSKAVQAATSPFRLPESTYRLQFHAGFTFRDALAIVPYLRDLGITHCYASPYLKARPGSTHGYDIIDHGSLNPEIGSLEDYEAWTSALRSEGLGQILDMVPNHMAVGTNDNAWWNDVLENGESSRFDGYFDISWRASPRLELKDKILLPVLGEPYGDVLESGQLRLAFQDGAFFVHYFERRFPVSPQSYASVLGHRLEEWVNDAGSEDPPLVEYQSILTAIRHLPERMETDPGKVAEHQREKEVIKRRLATLTAESERARAFIEQNITQFNGRPGEARSFDLLDLLLEHQCYRLAFWRVAPDEINYRRFFDINELAALSMERAEVFEASHGLILRLLAEGKLDGLRIDHPDGLYDPAQYFRRLQEHYLLACAQKVFADEYAGRGLDWKDVQGPLREALDLGGDGLVAQPVKPGPPLYVVVEKILAAGEALVETWAVCGTSGYDILNQINGLFVDGENAQAFNRLYEGWIQDEARHPEVVYQKKLLIMEVSLSSELYMLTHQLDRLAQKSRRSRDFTFNTVRRALRAVIACFPVYRSYIADEGVNDADRRYIELAVRRAIARNPLLSRRVFAFIRDMLLLKFPEAFNEEDRAEQRRFAGKFQQVTAPVTAKGVEDTAFYVYNRLISLNEVGGEPGRFGVRPESVHAYNRVRQAKWPYSLSPLSTHDTKRSEDVRARINVLSEMPEEWQACLVRWSRLNEAHRLTVEDMTVPDGNEEYLLYQTLLGAWPLQPASAEESPAFVERIKAYMLKALHEAKVHTSWINPNLDYDNAVAEFVGRILDEGTNRAFLDDFRVFQARISHFGLFNSLAQTLLRIAAPGVPDTYQGTEVWDFSLVDPDNRRPVDYARLSRMYGELRAATLAAGEDVRELARSLVDTKEDGRIKLHVTDRALHCRREHPGLFSGGEYIPVPVVGAKAGHVFAFARRSADHCALVAVPRLLARLAPDMARPPFGEAVWEDTRLDLSVAGTGPGWRWRNVFTGEVLVAREEEGMPSLTAAEVFANFPVALFLGMR